MLSSPPSPPSLPLSFYPRDLRGPGSRSERLPSRSERLPPARKAAHDAAGPGGSAPSARARHAHLSVRTATAAVRSVGGVLVRRLLLVPGRTESTGALPPTASRERPWSGIYLDAVVCPLTLDPVDGNEKFADAAGSKAIADQFKKKIGLVSLGGAVKPFPPRTGSGHEHSFFISRVRQST